MLSLEGRKFPQKLNIIILGRRRKGGGGGTKKKEDKNIMTEYKLVVVGGKKFKIFSIFLKKELNIILIFIICSWWCGQECLDNSAYSESVSTFYVKDLFNSMMMDESCM